MRTLQLFQGHFEPSVYIDSERIYFDRDVTGVEFTIYTAHGTFSAKGSSRRNPADEDNAEIAELLAVSRALQNLASGLTRRIEGLIKHQADMNDYKLVQAETKARRQAELEVKRIANKPVLAKITRPKRVSAVR